MFYVYGFYWAILKIKIMIFSSSYLGPFSKKSNPFIFLTHSSRHQPPPNDHLYHHGTKSSSSSTKSSSSSTSTETTAASISSSSPWRWIHSFVADLELFFLGRILVVKFGCLCSGGEKMIKKPDQIRISADTRTFSRTSGSRISGVGGYGSGD